MMPTLPTAKILSVDDALEQARTASALDALTANAPIGFAFFYTHANAALAEISGVPVCAHIGRTIQELLPANAEAVIPVLDRVFATGQAISGFEVDGEMPGRPRERRSWLTGSSPSSRRTGPSRRSAPPSSISPSANAPRSGHAGADAGEWQPASRRCNYDRLAAWLLAASGWGAGD